MDATAVAAALEDFRTTDRGFPFEAAAKLTVLDAEGNSHPLASLYTSALHTSVVVFGRNLL
jgi:hypothetical protein